MFSTTHLDNVNPLNPYQPSGSNSDAQADPTYQPKRMGSFLMIQFVTFVPTLFVLHVLFFIFDTARLVGLDKAVAYLFQFPSPLRWMIAFDIGCWLPHALLAVISRRSRSVGPVLTGLVGGGIVAIGMSIMVFSVIAMPETGKYSRELPIYLVILLLVSPSLITTAILSRFQSNAQMSPLSQTDRE